jgi:hypothetical protein
MAKVVHRPSGRAGLFTEALLTVGDKNEAAGAAVAAVLAYE